MISCARATRGLRRPSLNTRSGRPSSPPSKERRKSDGRSMRAVKDSLALLYDERDKPDEPDRLDPIANIVESP